MSIGDWLAPEQAWGKTSCQKAGPGEESFILLDVIEGKTLDEMNKFKCLGGIIIADVKCMTEVNMHKYVKQIQHFWRWKVSYKSI